MPSSDSWASLNRAYLHRWVMAIRDWLTVARGASKVKHSGSVQSSFSEPDWPSGVRVP